MQLGTASDLKRAFLDLVAVRLRENPRCRFIGFEVSRHGLDKAGGRVIDMPIAEESTLGVAVGMSRTGAEVFVDLMFEAFAWRTFDVLMNQLALTRLLPIERRAPLTVRLLSGPFPGAGPQHGGSGAGVLVRVPWVRVAAPCTPDDVGAAWRLACDERRPLLLLCGDGCLSQTKVHGNGLDQLHCVGSGRRLCVVCWGLHAPLVVEAVTRCGAWEKVVVCCPLFLSPLPSGSLLDIAGGARRVLVVDAPTPSSVGDALISQLLMRLGPSRVRTMVLWREDIGAAFDRDHCTSRLARTIGDEVET